MSKDYINDYISDYYEETPRKKKNKSEEIIPKTLCGLKKIAKRGIMSVEISEYYGKTGDEIPERFRGVRKVVGANSVAFLLSSPNSNAVSELYFTSGLLTDVDECDRIMTLYDWGKREPNEQEKALLDKWAEIEADCLRENPFADVHKKKMLFFKDSEYPYMSGIESISGKSKKYDLSTGLVSDSQTKGEAIMKYKLYFDAANDR